MLKFDINGNSNFFGVLIDFISFNTYVIIYCPDLIPF